MKFFMMLVLVLVVVTSAKEPCSYLEIKEDDFGETTKEGWVRTREGWMGFTLEGDGPTLRCNTWTYSANLIPMPIGTTLRIAFENGEILELTTVEEVMPGVGVSNNSVWQFKFLLSPEELEILSSSELLAAKIKIYEETRTLEFGRDGKALQNMALCFLDS